MVRISFGGVSITVLGAVVDISSTDGFDVATVDVLFTGSSIGVEDLVLSTIKLFGLFTDTELMTAGTTSVLTRGVITSFTTEGSAGTGTDKFLFESALIVAEIVWALGDDFSTFVGTTVTALTDEAGDGFAEEVELFVDSFIMSLATSSNCIFKVSRSANDLSTPGLLANRT